MSDHVHDNGDGDESSEGCPMIMTFHAGHCEAILFKTLTVKSVGEFILAFVVIFVVSVAYEGLKFWREKLYNDYASETSICASSTKASTSELTVEQNSKNVERKSIRQLLTHRMHLAQSLLHLVQVTLSYALMLIIMTYNVWLLLAVVFGASVGYFLFGWIRQRSIDIAEHCH